MDCQSSGFIDDDYIFILEENIYIYIFRCEVAWNRRRYLDLQQVTRICPVTGISQLSINSNMPVINQLLCSGAGDFRTHLADVLVQPSAGFYYRKLKLL